MGCSDVSEFEHIYGQIVTTPSCVYGRLFTWTRMVYFNALIVWKTFIDICFSIKSSLWALTAAYTKFRRIIWSKIWSCGHRSRSPMCTVTYSSKRRETSLNGISWKHKILWFPGASSHYRCWSTILVTTAMTQPPPSSFPILPPTSATPPFNEGLGYHHGKIVELKMFVGTFRASWRFNALNYFPLKQKGKFSRPISLFFCRPRISVTHFASPGVPLDAPGCRSEGLPGVPRILQWRGSRRGAWPGGLWDVRLPVGSRGRAPVGVLGDEVPQKLKQNVKLVYNF